MTPIPRYPLWVPGSVEYILVKAGLFHLDLLDVTPTDRLMRLRVPPEDILPVLLHMAEVAAIERGGAIDTGSRRSRIIGELRALGLRHEQIGDLFVWMGKGAWLAAEDRRKRPAPLPL
jgi:hypothetical protein